MVTRANALAIGRVSSHPNLGGTVQILTENPECRLDLSQDAKCLNFEKQ